MQIKTTANWRLYWGVMPLPQGAEAMGVVHLDGRAGALLKLASGQYVQGNAGGIRTLSQSDVVASLGAASLGRKGGSSTSAAKKAASRENGKRGGRPKKD